MKSEKIKIILVHLFVFLFLLVFFVNICHIVPYDKDDWIYLGRLRIPLPLWDEWNPSRILPEVVMPLCGYMAAYLLYPITGDYILSITIMAAVILTIFITGLCYCIMLFLIKRLNVSVDMALVLEALFLIFTFLIFRNRGTSRYLFYAEDFCCIFYYILPGIINAISILIMMQYQDFQKAYDSFSTVKKGLFITLVYFAVYSHVFHSCAILIYSGLICLSDFKNVIYNKKPYIKKYIQEHKIYLFIITMWLIGAILELNGERASYMSSDVGISFEVSLRQLVAITRAVATPYKLIIVATFGWLIYRIGKKKEYSDIYCFMFINLILVVVYLIILCAKVQYMSRMDASWCIWFYVILITIIGIADWFKVFYAVKPILVPLLLILGITAFYPDGRFSISTIRNVDYVTCVQTGEYIINQIVSAEKAGCNSVMVHVPYVEDEAIKWTFADDFGTAITNTLYNHGIIQRKIEVETFHDPDFLSHIKVDIREY